MTRHYKRLSSIIQNFTSQINQLSSKISVLTKSSVCVSHKACNTSRETTQFTVHPDDMHPLPSLHPSYSSNLTLIIINKVYYTKYIQTCCFRQLVRFMLLNRYFGYIYRYPCRSGSHRSGTLGCEFPVLKQISSHCQTQYPCLSNTLFLLCQAGIVHCRTAMSAMGNLIPVKIFAASVTQYVIEWVSPRFTLFSQ